MSQYDSILRKFLFIFASVPTSAYYSADHIRRFAQPLDLERRQSTNTPLIVTNNCGETIYPGILTQGGTGPGTGGFQLTAGSSRTMSVSENWQGRVWGRTNCTFNGGSSGMCSTGDCGGVVSCTGTGQVPTTLAEMTMDAGDGHTYYDISLVDGYNLPMAMVLQPNNNQQLSSIPHHLTNPSCVGSVGNLQPPGYNPYNGGQTFLNTNAQDPLPWNNQTTQAQVAQWCPYNLQVSSSTGPNGGVYIYPDGSINRPQFDPCYSACSKWNLPQDCCTGQYNSPSSCKPSQYSQSAKSVCPDAYSYAYDDQTSTFIIPSGAGFEVVFCPGARSTNILATSRQQLNSYAQTARTARMVEERQAAGSGSDQAPDRPSLPQINIINQLPHAANMPQHLTSNSTRTTARYAMAALIVVASYAIGFL